MTAPKSITRFSEPARVSMAEEWFQFVDGNHFWMQWRLRALLREKGFLPDKQALCLEIGCGSGVFRAQLESTLGLVVDGCDLVEDVLRRADPGRGDLFVYNVFDRLPQLACQYDAVFLMDVVEHVTDDASFLNACLHVLKTGGRLVLNVPAHPFLFSRYDEIAGHVRRYSHRALHDLCTGQGTRVEKIVPWGFSLLPLAGVRKLTTPLVSRANVIKHGFMPPFAIIDRILTAVMHCETALPCRPPLGTSFLVIATKL